MDNNMDLEKMLAGLRQAKRKPQQDSEFSGWKIIDPEFNNIGDRTPNPRAAVVPQFLYEQYRIEVENRYGKFMQPDKEKFQRIAKFITTCSQKCGLLLYGSTGTGKTTYLKAIEGMIRMLYRYEIQTSAITIRSFKASELGVMMKDDKDNYHRLKRACVLLLDDIGFAGDAEMVNNYGIKTNPVVDVIEHRYDKQLFTVMTTNLTEQDIKERYGARIYSRLSEMCMWVAFTGKDYRI